MTTRTLFAAALCFIPNLSLAKSQPPLVPTALVEDVRSTAADVEFMDYVGPGQTIKLEPKDVLVLSYLKSCTYEKITGGTVSIGLDRSDVQGGKVARSQVPCNGGNVKLGAGQANASGASSFRLQNVAIDPTVYSVTPLIQIPKAASGERLKLSIASTTNAKNTIEIDASLAKDGYYDLAKANKKLKRGEIYTASLGSHKVVFRVDPKAKSGKAPAVSRLLQFPAD